MKRVIDALTHRNSSVSADGAQNDRDALDKICTAYASITYSRLDSRGRVQLAAELPLLYTAGRWPTPSEVHDPRPNADEDAIPRRVRESELAVDPLLESMSAHRYRYRT